MKDWLIKKFENVFRWWPLIIMGVILMAIVVFMSDINIWPLLKFFTLFGIILSISTLLIFSIFYTKYGMIIYGTLSVVLCIIIFLVPNGLEYVSKYIIVPIISTVMMVMKYFLG